MKIGKVTSVENGPERDVEVRISAEELYSEAKAVQIPEGENNWGRRVFWYGNFFPDMRAWDKLDANRRRGAGGRLSRSVRWAEPMQGGVPGSPLRRSSPRTG